MVIMAVKTRLNMAGKVIWKDISKSTKEKNYYIKPNSIPTAILMITLNI